MALRWDNGDLTRAGHRLFGFLLGSVIAGAGLYYYVIDEYKVSNELLTEDIYVSVAVHTNREESVLTYRFAGTPSGRPTDRNLRSDLGGRGQDEEVMVHRRQTENSWESVTRVSHSVPVRVQLYIPKLALKLANSVRA